MVKTRGRAVTRPLIIGVTGGIGSGKSTVCAEFAQLGIPVIDTDQVARDVVVPGSEGLAAVVEEFGTMVLAADGTLDRAKLRGIVFADSAKRERLEALLHPRIRARVAKLIESVTSPYCLLGIPLLVERGNHQQVDRILVVDCPTEIQIARVRARDKLTDDEVTAIMRTQATRDLRLAKADDVVMNDTDLDNIRRQVNELHARYLAQAATRPA